MKNLAIVLIAILLTSTTFAFEKPASSLKQAAKFVNVDQAKQLLTTEDLFTNSWSQFDISARLQKKEGSKQELFDFIASQALEWTAEEKTKLGSIFADIDKSVAEQGFNLSLPAEVFFVKTTAKEEGGAGGYTRGTYIVLKNDVVSRPENELKQTVIHELFHILTRNDDKFRRDMYSIIGFKMMNSIKYPASISDFRITNPDAPQTDSYITLKKDGKPVDCMMILYASEPYESGLFFKYLNVGFMKLKGTKVKEPELLNGRPIIYSMNDVRDFFEQVGRNTQYILHPEEIMADNFAYAINNRKKQPTQSIIDSIQKRLKQKS